MRKIWKCFVILVMLVPACHQVTEYSMGEGAGLTFIRTSDFQVVKYLDGLDGARSAVYHSASGKIAVTSSLGILHIVDMEEMEIDTAYSIGGSSGTGYGDAVISGSGDLYVLGPGSQVIEVDLFTGAVVDHFQPGPYPGALAASPNPDFLYFIETVEDYIGQIWTYDNITGFTSPTYYPLADIMVEPGEGKHIVAVCSNSRGNIYGVWLNLSSAARLLMQGPGTQLCTGSPCSTVLPLGLDSVYVVGCPRWNNESGLIMFVEGYVVYESKKKLEVEGHPVEMCFNSHSGIEGNLSVLGITDSKETVITVYGFPDSYMQPEVQATLQLDGYPRDILSPMYGEYIVVLTSD